MTCYDQHVKRHPLPLLLFIVAPSKLFNIEKIIRIDRGHLSAVNSVIRCSDGNGLNQLRNGEQIVAHIMNTTYHHGTSYYLPS